MNHHPENEPQGKIMGENEPSALPLSPLESDQHPTVPGTHDVIRSLNRNTTWVATGLLGTVFFAALVLALQERHPKTDDLAEARQTTGNLLPNANLTGISEVVSSTEKSTGEKTSGAATSTELGIASEFNPPGPQANSTSWSPVQVKDSAKVVRLKMAKARDRSSARPRIVDVKTRLIALWHQSLMRNEGSSGWTLFSNSSKWRRKKISYTAATNH